jgi:hypothetical protein
MPLYRINIGFVKAQVTVNRVPLPPMDFVGDESAVP